MCVKPEIGLMVKLPGRPNPKFRSTAHLWPHCTFGCAKDYIAVRTKKASVKIIYIVLFSKLNDYIHHFHVQQVWRQVKAV